MPEHTQDEEGASGLIRTLAYGALNDEATKGLNALVLDLERQERLVGGKPKGSITIKISFQRDRGVLVTHGTVDVKYPAKVPARAFLYSGPDGRLSENDIRQGQLFGSVERAEPKDVSTGSVARVLDIAAPREPKDTKMAQANDR